ncbi:MAG: 2,4-dihydroxyhept-2-ene-1,7-dioic acid aldolase [Parcubacteria group bacterium]|nr:2,4-dihydroxyhept-2-ene-1,7-dioic acid aldolase [Parcubacteria group bacterium]
MFNGKANSFNLRKKLRENKFTIGSWVSVGHTAIVEIMAMRDFDWLVIDMEHSVITLDKAQELIKVIEANSVVPLVRVSENSPVAIKRVMDAGAYGVIVPMVNSKLEAQRAVASVKYPPLGQRGVGLGRAQGYGMEFDKYKQWVNKNSVVVVQIEHIDAIDNLEDILQTKGVDASIIGPYDLSASMGFPGEFERKELKIAIKKYIEVCKKVNKPAGYHVIAPEKRKVEEKIEAGFRFISFSLDTLFLGVKIEQELNMINKGIKL